MSRNRRDYTEDFKADAISLALRSSSMRKAADSLGLPESTLTTWVKKASKKSISSLANLDMAIKKFLNSYKKKVFAVVKIELLN